MATYLNTELGQVQQALNAMCQKRRRKREKAKKSKAKLDEYKEKAAMDALSKIDKVKYSSLQSEYKHTIAELAALDDEVQCLKDLKEGKKRKKEEQEGEIFHAEKEPENDDTFLANLYGVTADDLAKDKEQELNFSQL